MYAIRANNNQWAYSDITSKLELLYKTYNSFWKGTEIDNGHRLWEAKFDLDGCNQGFFSPSNNLHASSWWLLIECSQLHQ